MHFIMPSLVYLEWHPAFLEPIHTYQEQNVLLLGNAHTRFAGMNIPP